MAKTRLQGGERKDKKEGKSSNANTNLRAPDSAALAYNDNFLIASNSGYNSLHYDATDHHQVQRLPVSPVGSIPSYASTTYIIEEGTSISPRSLTNSFDDTPFLCQDGLVQGSKLPDISTPHSAGESNSGVGLLPVILNQNDTNMKESASQYSNVVHDALSHTKQANMMPHDLCSANNYATTFRICHIAPDNSSSPRVPQHLGFAIAQPSTPTSLSFDTVRVHIGSDIDLSVEAPEHLVTEHVLDRYQLDAWVRQKSAGIMTFTERLEKNKDTWRSHL